MFRNSYSDWRSVALLVPARPPIRTFGTSQATRSVRPNVSGSTPRRRSISRPAHSFTEDKAALPADS